MKVSGLIVPMIMRENLPKRKILDWHFRAACCVGGECAASLSLPNIPIFCHFCIYDAAHYSTFVKFATKYWT